MYLLADQSSNAKLSKNADITSRWQTSILYLSPADSSGLGVNLCPAASPGCKAACLNTAGRGVMSSVQLGRLRKTKLFVQDRAEFLRQLQADLMTLRKRQERTGIRQAVRLNGTSDIAWEDRGIIQEFPDLMFYDYTKRPDRAIKSVSGSWPMNYHLTFSRSEVNQRATTLVAENGVNVAVVFSGDKLPERWGGLPVIDGTEHDMRFLDPQRVVVGLLAKGKARADRSGFAINLNTEGAA